MLWVSIFLRVSAERVQDFCRTWLWHTCGTHNAWAGTHGQGLQDMAGIARDNIAATTTPETIEKHKLWRENVWAVITKSMGINWRMTKLSSIPDSQLSITWSLCKHYSMLEVTNLIAVVGEDATAHDVRQRYCCPKCKVKDNKTYQIKETQIWWC